MPSPPPFAHALRDLLATEHRKAAEPGRITGWAASHTAETDGLLAPGNCLVELALRLPVALPAAVDLNRRGKRPTYVPLLAYAVTRAGLRDPAILAAARAGVSAAPALAGWWALTLAAWGEKSDVLPGFVARQRATGEFLDASPYDSPDLHWYDELVLLHAVATFAELTNDPAARAAAARAADFHTAETQPDHATTQPWALHAFALRDETRPLADLLLHGALAQNAGRLDTIGRILVADAVLSLGV